MRRVTRTLTLSEHDLAGWARRFTAGEAPSPLPYGVDVLEGLGFELSGVALPEGRRWREVRDVVDHRAGFPVAPALLGLPAAWRADLVLALLERQGMLPGLLRRTPLPPYGRRPLVIWSCWLA